MNISPNHSEAAIELLQLPKFGCGVGLHRMAWIRDQLNTNDWRSNPDVLKITGSKGKGSTSAFCAAILSTLGLKVGLFTSPHLLRFNERIKVGGSDVSDDDLATSWRQVKDLMAAYRRLHPDDSFGSFEAFTAVAFDVFQNNNVSAVVCEAGIGGRYDSTRPFPGSTVALTSVELEHTELLGNTTELIAYDKADLCPARGTLVVGRIDEELIRRLGNYCRLRSVAMVNAAADSEISDVRVNSGIMRFTLKSVGIDFGDVSTSLIGEHQAGNATVAVAATWHWLLRNRPDVTQDRFKIAVIEALENVRWPGRLEKIMENPDMIIDVGHTPHSMRSVASTVRKSYSTRPLVLLTGVSKDKDAVGILKEIVPLASVIVCTSPCHKGAPAERVAAICRELRPGAEIIVEETIVNAVHVALNLARSRGMMVLVAGGLFLSIEAMVAAQGADPSVLQFA
jgi:dihydrofolate synthase/folylpolyglutamate synthase